MNTKQTIFVFSLKKLFGTIRYREQLAMRLDNTFPKGDFLVLYSFCIILYVSSIVSYHTRMYHEKQSANETPILS